MARPEVELGASPSTRGYFSPPVERRYAGDRAHRGDIVGALGRIASFDTEPRSTMRRRLAALLAVMGPGIVVMVSDNDAGSISLFAQAGKVYGLQLLWVFLLLAAVLYVNQEMSGRLGAITGSGFARLIRVRFGARWGAFALSDLLIVNVLTIVTEIVGVRFALGYFGVSEYAAVPIAVTVLIALVSMGSFRRWERAMYVCVLASLCILPLVLLTHQHTTYTVLPNVKVTSTIDSSHAVLFAIAFIGSAVAPWQIFLQQSNVADKRITSRWLSFERADTAIGTALFVLGAAAITVVCAHAFSNTNVFGRLANAGTIAHDLSLSSGSPVGALFAIVLFDGSILGASAISLSTSYAVGDYFGLKHSLHRSWRDARTFHLTLAVSVIVAGALVLISGSNLGLITISVQALAGVLLPSATVMLLLLCNDKEVLGPWVNSAWMNFIATAVVGIILALCALLVTTTLAPSLPVVPCALSIGAVLALAFVGLGFKMGTVRSKRLPRAEHSRAERQAWSMPDIDCLAAPVITRRRSFWFSVLRVYLTLTTAVLVLRFIQLIVGHH